MQPTSLSPASKAGWLSRLRSFLRENGLLLLLLLVIVGVALWLPPQISWLVIAYGVGIVVLSMALMQLRRSSVRVRDAEEQTQAILDAAGDGILSVDEQGRILSFNPAAERLFGRPTTEVIGQPIKLLVPALEMGSIVPAPHRWGAPAAGGRQTIDGLRADGARFPLDLSVASGEVSGRRTFIIIARDLTEVRRAEDALDRERTLLARLMEHLPDRIYFKDEQSRFLRVNRAMAELFRLADPAELEGHSDFDYFTAEHAGPAFRDEKEVMRTGEPIIGLEEKETLPDGRIGWVSTTKMALRDKEGRIVGTFGVSRDITAKKLAEAELHKAKEAAEQSAEWARLVVDTAYDAFVVMDEQGRITDWNRQAEVIFGWSRAEAVGRLLADTIVPPDYRDRHTRGLERFLATGEGPVLRQRLELPALHHDGHTFPVELTIIPIRQGDRNVFSAFLHDITARKLAEAELHKAKEAAEAANRAKSEFLANMSHEIRTPMNGVIGMTELALGTNLTPEQREYLQMVKSSAESLMTILNDILDFSKIEARKLVLDPVTFNLRDAVGDTMRAMAVRAQQKGLELACHVSREVPEYVVGDAGRLRQVLVNLVGNAIKFTSRGEVVVGVSLAQHEARSASEVGSFHPLTPNLSAPSTVQRGDSVPLQFQEKDTGIGIPAEKQASIFQPFEQADHSTTRRFGGTGLGLAISTQLVELMGGKLQVHSEAGQGSTFSFAATFGIPTEVPVVATPSRVELSGLRVLIVDDNATNRRILEEVVHGWGMVPALCECAPEALRELERAAGAGEPYPLVLLDVHMPDVDGFMLAAQVQKTPMLAGTVLIMLTSAGRPDDIARCRDLGINAYLLKPVKQSDLLATILTALDGSRRLPAPREVAAPSAARSLRVLLAEDNVVNQKLAVRLLQKQGHTVTVVVTGKQALEAVAAASFDVVLMDVQMPEMDGLEATAAIREREATHGGRLPIVAMTAHAMKGDREKCLAAGMDGYVSKPIQPRELIEAIELAMNQG